MKKVLIYIILIFISISCEDLTESELFLESKVTTIEYGTSFGECIGYCNTSISITNNNIEYTASSNSDTYPTISQNVEIDEDVLNNLLEKVDFIIFRNLDEIIGCPDCADGGAEWVSIKTNDLSHKVTFEYQNTPEEILDLIHKLREIFDSFNI
jgi:hypothetical protein